MNFQTTVIIVLLLVCLGGAYFLFFQGAQNEDAVTLEKPALHAVYGITKADVTQVAVSFADSAYQDLRLRKTETGTWRIAAPFAADADPEKVAQLLDDFLNKRVKQELEVPGYAEYGLDAPTLTFSLWTDGTEPIAVFALGKKAINFSVYTKERADRHIFLIESSALDDLAKSPTDLRDRAVFTADPATVSHLQFTLNPKSSETVACERQGDTWQITQPIAAAADTQEIERLLTELRSLRVSTFEADGDAAAAPALLARTGLAEPRLQVALTTDTAVTHLHIGAAAEPEPDRVYVKALPQNTVYTVTDAIYTLLNTSLFALREKRVMDFQRTDTVRIEIKNGARTAVCTKNYENRWKLHTESGRVPADAKAVDDLLFGVDSLEAVAFVENGAARFATPIQVSFTQRGADKPSVLHIGDAAADGTYFVKAGDSAQVFRVKPRLIEQIALGAAWLRDKQVLDFHIDAAIRLTFRGEDSLTCQRLGTNWRLTLPVKEDANNRAVNAIIYELDDLRAAAFAGPDTELTDNVTGLSEPSRQLTVELRDRKVYTLQIGKANAAGRFYARLQHEPELVFLLTSEQVSTLTTSLALLRGSAE